MEQIRKFSEFLSRKTPEKPTNKDDDYQNNHQITDIEKYEKIKDDQYENVQQNSHLRTQDMIIDPTKYPDLYDANPKKLSDHDNSIFDKIQNEQADKTQTKDKLKDSINFSNISIRLSESVIESEDRLKKIIASKDRNVIIEKPRNSLIKINRDVKPVLYDILNKKPIENKNVVKIPAAELKDQNRHKEKSPMNPKKQFKNPKVNRDVFDKIRKQKSNVILVDELQDRINFRNEKPRKKSLQNEFNYQNNEKLKKSYKKLSELLLNQQNEQY